MIQRPNVKYVEKGHKYTLDGVKLDGVSTVSKIGEDEVWGMAGARGFRIGYEGAYELLIGDNEAFERYDTPDELREALKQARKTPWHKTDDAKERGNAIHSALEQLAQKGQLEPLNSFPEAYHGFVQALARWYLDYRPSFEATEVQVVSVTHKFAGRYDIRAIINFDKWYPDEHLGDKLCLIDLKTGKGVYPTSHFPQLAGYELAGVEMGYPKTDAQFVLNCKEDGTYEFKRSNATAEHFLAYLAAHRAIVDLKAKNKKARQK